MTLKDTLKKVKLNESTISMLLGALVIVVVGVAAVNFLGDNRSGEIIPGIESEDISQIGNSLPTQHTVEAGEDLWKISEQYYNTGYNWVAIAEANNITNPNQLNEGDQITIPALEDGRIAADLDLPQVDEEEVVDEDVTEVEPTTAPAEPADEQPEPVLAEEDTNVEEIAEQTRDTMIEGETYTVVQGDTLWHIAERAYGDAYRWVDIAEANDLANPNLIHAGNSFVIPR